MPRVSRVPANRGSPTKRAKDGTFINTEALSQNSRQLMFLRISIAAISGCGAGILGLTNLFGFAFYFVMAAVCSLMLLVRTGFAWSSYFVSWRQFAYGHVLGEMVTYIFFWTFIYGLVHVY